MDSAEIIVDEKTIKETAAKLKELKADVKERWQKGGFEKITARLAELKKEMEEPTIWNNPDRAKDIIKEEKSLKESYEPWNDLLKSILDTEELFLMARDDKDLDTIRDIIRETEKIQATYDNLESLAFLDDEDDEKNAFLTIHPGAGGTESQDWAMMLSRMFMRWATLHEFQTEIIDSTPGEQAGLKSFTILVTGTNAYGLLQGESGVHRLVRISPFDANKRRHTSFASVFVTPEVDETIDININDEDLRIDTYRASGAGGQHINKTDSAVRITHLPSGIVVQCQNERSQHKNKAQAMKVLLSSLYRLEKEKMKAAQKERQPEKKEIAWGSQIRSYVFHPYNMAKDHRTGHETGNIQGMMNGELLDDFIYAYLKAESLKQVPGAKK